MHTDKTLSCHWAPVLGIPAENTS